MNLYIRVLYLLIKLKFCKPLAHPLDESYHSLRVWPNDLDFNLHANNGRILTMLDLGRFKLLSDAGLLKATLKRKWLPVLGSAKVHFLRPLKLWQKLDIRTKVIYWDDKWIYLEQNVYVKDHLKVTALLKAAFLHQSERVDPKKIIALLPIDPQTPEIPRKLHAWLHAEQSGGK